MRRTLTLTAAALSVGCAYLGRPPSGFYRVPGHVPTPTPPSAEEGAQAFDLRLVGGDVLYGLQASVVDGEVRLRIDLHDFGRAPIQYDLRRARLRAEDGTALELAAVEELPSRRPSGAALASAAYRRGEREIGRGERNAVTRRYALPEGLEGARAAKVLRRLTLEDEVRIGDRVEAVDLVLEKAR